MSRRICNQRLKEKHKIIFNGMIQSKKFDLSGVRQHTKPKIITVQYPNMSPFILSILKDIWYQPIIQQK